MHETEFHRLIALAVFVGTYVGLGIGRLPPFRVDRTGVAIIGAAVMVVTGVIPWDRAVAAVDAHTLVLLFGMMIVAAYLRLSGVFRLVTDLAMRRARGPGGCRAGGAAGSVLRALPADDQDSHRGADHARGVSRRRADRARRHRGRRVHAPHAPGQAGEGLSRDRLGAAGALQRPL